MADEKTIIMPDGQNNGGWGNIPAVLALNGLGYNNYPPYAYNNGGLFGGSYGRREHEMWDDDMYGERRRRDSRGRYM